MKKKFHSVRPPEMERVEVDFSTLGGEAFFRGFRELSIHLEREV